MKQVKAIFIDATKQVVEVVQIGTDLKSIYDRIGLQCGMIELVSYMDARNVLYIDEEGRFDDHGKFNGSFVGFLIDVSEVNDFSRFFPVVGNGVIIALDEEGEHDNVSYNPLDAIKRVKFLSGTEVEKLKLE